MATKKAEPAKEPKVMTNLGRATDEPINPAIDPTKTAQERLDALTAQRVEMQARADRGEQPD